MHRLMGSGIEVYLVWAARGLAAFIAAVLLAFIGDLTGRVFNLLLGYPWPQAVHLNIHMVCIGVGAGFGAYLGWMNLSLSRYRALGFLSATIAAGIVGIYVGRAYGPGVDPTYWWSRFAVDPTVHLAGVVIATFTAAVIRLLQHWFQLRSTRSQRQVSSMTMQPPN